MTNPYLDFLTRGLEYYTASLYGGLIGVFIGSKMPYVDFSGYMRQMSSLVSKYHKFVFATLGMLAFASNIEKLGIPGAMGAGTGVYLGLETSYLIARKLLKLW